MERAERDQKLDAIKAHGLWSVIAVCRVCGEKRRTVASIIEHIVEAHPNQEANREFRG